MRDPRTCAPAPRPHLIVCLSLGLGFPSPMPHLMHAAVTSQSHQRGLPFDNSSGINVMTVSFEVMVVSLRVRGPPLYLCAADAPLGSRFEPMEISFSFGGHFSPAAAAAAPPSLLNQIKTDKGGRARKWNPWPP